MSPSNAVIRSSSLNILSLIFVRYFFSILLWAIFCVVVSLRLVVLFLLVEVVVVVVGAEVEIVVEAVAVGGAIIFDGCDCNGSGCCSSNSCWGSKASDSILINSVELCANWEFLASAGLSKKVSTGETSSIDSGGIEKVESNDEAEL